MPYYWLRPGTEEKLATLREQGLLGDVEVSLCKKTGRRYIVVYDDPMNPAMATLAIPQDVIDKVTYTDKIYADLRQQGIYRHRGGEMVVNTMYDHSDECHYEYQEIGISAPSLEVLKEIYTLVRQRKLEPEENWGYVAPSQDEFEATRATERKLTEVWTKLCRISGELCGRRWPFVSRRRMAGVVQKLIVFIRDPRA